MDRRVGVACAGAAIGDRDGCCRVAIESRSGLRAAPACDIVLSRRSAPGTLVDRRQLLGDRWCVLADSAGGSANRLPAASTGTTDHTATQNHLISAVGPASGHLRTISRSPAAVGLLVGRDPLR